MRFVIVESPYAGDVERNVRYARAAVTDCLHRGEAPFASHLLYTQPGVLLDDHPEERELGIAAGLEIARRAEASIFYVDLGISRGMAEGWYAARDANREVEIRTLEGEW